MPFWMTAGAGGLQGWNPEPVHTIDAAIQGFGLRKKYAPWLSFLLLLKMTYSDRKVNNRQ